MRVWALQIILVALIAFLFSTKLIFNNFYNKNITIFNNKKLKFSNCFNCFSI